MAIRFSMVISVGVSVCRIVSSTDARCCLSSCSIIASSTEPAEDNGISEAFRWYEPLGPVPEVTAADQEDESFAAHAAIVADAAADCKRGKRANGALERASFGENGAFRRGSAGIRACAGRARRARRGGEAGQNRRRAMGQICKTDGTVSHCPVFKGFRAFDPRFSPLHQWDRKQIYN